MSSADILSEMGEVVFDHTQKQAMCLVFPAYGEAKYLLGNLERIKNQTYVPDILVIGGEKTEAVFETLELMDLPILAFKRKPEYFGPAGGFYTGEKVALALGYEKVVLGDDDAYLKEDDTLALIRGALEEHPLVMIREDLSGGQAGMHHFAGIRREAMLKTGLTYRPSYACFEDGEYERRYAKNGYLPFVIDRMRTHPMKETGLMFGWLLMRNNLKHYLFQEPSLGHYLKTALRTEAMAYLLEKNGEPENAAAMREALQEGRMPALHVRPDMSQWEKLKTEDTPWPAKLRVLSVGGSYEAVGADKEKLSNAQKIDVPGSGGLAALFAPLRAAFNQDVMVFGHNLLWLGFFSKSIRMYNPVGGAYYHAQNSSLQVVGNLFRVAGLLLSHACFFFTHAKRVPELAIGRYGMQSVDAAQKEEQKA